jgi:predicted ATPase
MKQVKSNNWYVLTGGPATGKTTLLGELAKLGYKTVPEAAREHIDNAYKKGIRVEDLRSNEKLFQEDVTRLKLRNEKALNPSQVTFLDRGMQDTTAYMNYYGFPIEKWLKEIIDASSYKKVFMLEPLAVDPHDYARTEDQKFMNEINGLLSQAYLDAGMELIYVPAYPLQERVKFIVKNIS